MKIVEEKKLADGSVKIFYSTLRDNILYNFLHKYYKCSIISNKRCILSDLINRCPFRFEVLDDNFSQIKFIIDEGQNLTITYKLIWEERPSENIVRYYLKDIV